MKTNLFCAVAALAASLSVASVAFADDSAAVAPAAAHQSGHTALTVATGLRVLSPDLMERASLDSLVRLGLLLPAGPQVTLYFEGGGSASIGHETSYGLELSTGTLLLNQTLRTGAVVSYEGLGADHKTTFLLGEVGVLIPLGDVLVLEPDVLLGAALGHESGLASGLMLSIEGHFGL